MFRSDFKKMYKRRVLVNLSNLEIMDILTGKKVLVGLPEDAVVIGFADNYGVNGVTLSIVSSQFGVVPEGVQAPHYSDYDLIPAFELIPERREMMITRTLYYALLNQLFTMMTINEEGDMIIDQKALKKLQDPKFVNRFIINPVYENAK